MLQESQEHEFDYYIDVFSDATYIPEKQNVDLWNSIAAITERWTVHLDQTVETDCSSTRWGDKFSDGSALLTSK